MATDTRNKPRQGAPGISPPATWQVPYVGVGPGQFSVIPKLMPYTVGEWVLMDDLLYTDKTGRPHAVPQYFITDLASIPWIAEPLFNSVDARLPGVVHDAFYCLNRMPRADCDALLAEMLDVTGCDEFRKRLIYAGVRLGGAGRYRACAGGPKREDFAWALMPMAQVQHYEALYPLHR